MPSIVRRLFADQRPVAMLQYGLIVALIASVAIGAMSSVGRKKGGHMFQRKKVPLGTTCRTGQICPESGVWRAMVPPPTGVTERSLTVFTSLDARRTPIAIGNHFPPFDRLAVNWVLVEYA